MASTDKTAKTSAMERRPKEPPERTEARAVPRSRSKFREYVEARQSAGPVSGKPLPEKQLGRFPR